MKIRNLNDVELKIFERLLSVDFNGVNELREQLANCNVTDTGDSDGYGSIYLHTSVAQPAQTTSNVPVEAEFMDSDEVPVFILLHLSNGLLHELEIYKADGNAIKRQIDPAELKVKVRE